MGRRVRAPDGYECFRAARAEVVALATLAPAVREALREGTLYGYAARHPRARTLVGRGAAYAVPLPGSAAAVVVRRSRHGGLLARLTGDRFLAPTRAPRELATALRLARAGVPTPELVAYATYPAGPLLRRADVATREVAGGRDLAAALAEAAPSADARRALLDAAGALVAALGAAGARHPDLNLKNVLIAPGPGGAPTAFVLDVDRVTFGAPGNARVTAANLRRLLRSAAKWRTRHGLLIAEAELAQLAQAVGIRAERWHRS